MTHARAHTHGTLTQMTPTRQTTHGTIILLRRWCDRDNKRASHITHHTQYDAQTHVLHMTKHTTHNTRHMPHDTHTRTRINEFRLRSCSVNWLNKSLYHITSHITYHTLTRHHTCTHPTHDRHHMVGIQDRSMSDRPVNQSHGVFNLSVKFSVGDYRLSTSNGDGCLRWCAKCGMWTLFIVTNKSRCSGDAWMKT